MRPVSIILTLLLALGAVEGLAYWWMHPVAAAHGEPVLAYRPVGRDPARSAHLSRRSEAKTDLSPAARDDKDQESGGGGLKEANAPAQSSSSTDNRQPTTDNSPPSSLTPLPEIYAKAAPMLRCSSGQVSHVQIDESLGLHLAFFEWDGTDTGSVLEAFRHMPEACMGAIGMKLIEKAPPRTYVVRGRGTEDRLSVVGGPLSVEELSEKSQPSSNQKSAINNLSRQSAAATDHKTCPGEAREDGSSITGVELSVVSGQLSEEELSEKSQSPTPKRTTSTDNGQRTTDNSSSSTLLFDHTIFREPGQGGGAAFASGPLVHAFRAVWVAGLSHADARQGLGGNEFNRLRTIRLQSALTRFRPTHARVIQGAVRGASSGDAAWQAFEQAMLKHLTFER